MLPSKKQAFQKADWSNQRFKNYLGSYPGKQRCRFLYSVCGGKIFAILSYFQHLGEEARARFFHVSNLSEDKKKSSPKIEELLLLNLSEDQKKRSSP